MSSFTSQAQDEERIRMQQEYQRIKPVIDREWCSSWASVGDDRCFWDKAGARRSGDNQNNVIIQQPQKNTGYPFPLSSIIIYFDNLRSFHCYQKYFRWIYTLYDFQHCQKYYYLLYNQVCHHYL